MRTLFLIITMFFAVCSFLVDAEARPAGALTDPKTGATFPARLGAFERRGGIGYDSEGEPNATYLAGRLILLNVYYYKDTLSFSQEFATCRDYVPMLTPNARLLSSQSSTLHGRGQRAVFSFRGNLFGGSNVKVFSELLLFQHRGRFLKFRVTYLADHAERARSEIDRFIRSFSLP